MALSNENGFVHLKDYHQESFSSEGDAYKYISKIDVNENISQENNIKSLSLDTFVTENNITRVDFIKIDVEGAEKLVLEGAIETIQRFRPKIIFECTNDWSKRFDYLPYEINLLLDSMDYSIIEYENEQWLATPK